MPMQAKGLGSMPGISGGGRFRSYEDDKPKEAKYLKPKGKDGKALPDYSLIADGKHDPVVYTRKNYKDKDIKLPNKSKKIDSRLLGSQSGGGRVKRGEE